MNGADLRFRLSRALIRERGVATVGLVSPVPGEPLALDVTTDDPYTSGTPDKKSVRRFRITIEEID